MFGWTINIDAFSSWHTGVDEIVPVTGLPNLVPRLKAASYESMNKMME